MGCVIGVACILKLPACLAEIEVHHGGRGLDLGSDVIAKVSHHHLVAVGVGVCVEGSVRLQRLGSSCCDGGLRVFISIFRLDGNFNTLSERDDGSVIDCGSVIVVSLQVTGFGAELTGVGGGESSY